MNPNARPFAFNPAAGSFVPSGGAPGGMPTGPQGVYTGYNQQMGGYGQPPRAGYGVPPPGQGMRPGPQGPAAFPYGVPPVAGMPPMTPQQMAQMTPQQMAARQQQMMQMQQMQQMQMQQMQQGGYAGHPGPMPPQPPHPQSLQAQQAGQQQHQQGGGGGGGKKGKGQQSQQQAQQQGDPPPMTAIQKAEARAKAAAEQAEKQAAAKKEANRTKKAEKAAAEKAAAEKAAAEEAEVEKAAAEKAAAEKAAAADKAAADKAAADKAAEDAAKVAADEKAAAANAAKKAEDEATKPGDSWEDASDRASEPDAPKEEATPPKQAEPKEASKPHTTAAQDDTESEPESDSKPKGKLAERDNREHLNLVFIGHVDAGKSTFCGQILYQTEQVDARTIEKYEKEAKEKNRESWFLAFIMDTNEEERAKGKTVEVGRAHFDSPSKRYTILDAPGHKNYVPNMIAGACQADVGVLVISARKGEFETGFERGGQTREHALLAKTLGVRVLLVVVNKMDDPTVEWAQERFEECKEKLTPFLKGCGYNIKKDVIFIPISALAATNVLKRPPGDIAPWYDGPCFIECLDSLPKLERACDAPLRLPILSKYKDLGTVVEGKVEQGTISLGDKLWVMPNRTPVEVIQLHLDQDEVSYLVGGENARVKLKDISDEDIQPGFVVSPRGELAVKAVRKFEAQLAIIELLDHKSIFSAGYTAILHVHAAAEECSIVKLTAQIDKKTGAKSKKPPMFVKSGAVVNCVVELENGAVCCETFESCPQLGRFTLRDEGKTIGIGKILEMLDSEDSK